MARLAGVAVGVVGGDRREAVLCAALVREGARVAAVGYPDLPELAGVTRVETVAQAVETAQVVIAPMSNTDDEGRLRSVLQPGLELRLDEAGLSRVRPGTPLLIGYARPCVREVAQKLGLRVVELGEQDDIAILNSIPTAEGALLLAFQELPITIHGSTCYVLGFGRCGVTLGRDLRALGARTVVFARDPAQLARAEEMGLIPRPFAELGQWIAEADCVFNTVPALVLTRPVLAAMPRGSLIIDLASPPGGTDFAAAAELGIKAILAPGLPGKVAPQTAGEILARTVPSLIAQLLSDERGGGEDDGPGR
ncbi:MAG: dipicolinate synthase subunit DpsA [Bacillota bacterium]|nr:dipicolinate synthase subunit DpsA [Bacillota bacterium]